MKKFNIDIYPEDLEQLVYTGEEDIPDEIKERYCRLIREIKQYIIQHPNNEMEYFTKLKAINLDEFIYVLDDFYRKGEESTTGALYHKRIFERYGLPTREERQKGIIPELPESYEEMANKFERKSVNGAKQAFTFAIERFIRHIKSKDMNFSIDSKSINNSEIEHPNAEEQLRQFLILSKKVATLSPEDIARVNNAINEILTEEKGRDGDTNG